VDINFKISLCLVNVSFINKASVVNIISCNLLSNSVFQVQKIMTQIDTNQLTENNGQHKVDGWSLQGPQCENKPWYGEIR
jgi:hypothetical protein